MFDDGWTEVGGASGATGWYGLYMELGGVTGLWSFGVNVPEKWKLLRYVLQIFDGMDKMATVVWLQMTRGLFLLMLVVCVFGFSTFYLYRIRTEETSATGGTKGFDDVAKYLIFASWWFVQTLRDALWPLFFAYRLIGSLK